MATDPTQIMLDDMKEALTRLETQPLSDEARLSLNTLQRRLESLAQALLAGQEQSRLAALYRVSQVLGTSLDLDEVLTQVMDAVISLTHAERGFLVLIEPDASNWRLRAARNFSQETLQNLEASRTVIQTALESGQGLLTTDASADPRFSDRESVLLYALRSIMCTPLLVRGHPIGAIYVDNRGHTGLFTPEDLDLLNALAAQAAIAIENARLYTQTDQALAQRIAELEVLAQVNRELNTDLDLDHVLEITRKWAAHGAKANRTWILLHDETDELTRPQDAAVAGEERKVGFDIGSLGPTGSSVQAGFTVYPKIEPDAQSAFLARGESIRRALAELTSQVTLPGDDALACLVVPITHSGRPLGVILAERPAPFFSAEIQFVSQLASRAAAAIANAGLYQAVQQANQAKSKFVSVVTHELRIPMTSIKGYADLLRQGTVGSLNEMQLDFLDVIRNNVERMSVLVSDLSDISRIESGRLKLDMTLIPVHGYIEETLRTLRPRLEEKEIGLEVDIAPDLPRVYADPNRVVQILNNLLSNAWKYTPSGGCIRVTAQIVAAGGFVRVEVYDTGIGISPEDQARLFTQFFRSEAPLVRQEQGWGLGLSVTRRLVEVMGGNIGFQSALGEGSEFWFTLPIQDHLVTS